MLPKLFVSLQKSNSGIVVEWKHNGQLDSATNVLVVFYRHLVQQLKGSSLVGQLSV
jgi:hypothetical protein